MRLLICIYLLSSSLFAMDAVCTALVRDEKKNLVKKEVTIKDLVSNSSFAGRYIKIVKGTSDDPISFDSSYSLRACTAYYHMSVARNYFLKRFDLKRLKKPRAIVTRIEMDRGFEESAHFMHENNGLFYNNAVTIPPSGPGRITDRPWYYEIWFAPKKKVKIESSTYKAAKLITSGPFLVNMLMGVGQSQATTIGIDLVRGTGFGASYYLKSLGLSLGVTTLVPHIIKWGARPLKQKIFLDSGMIPEVIYHEYSHFALSEHLSIDRHSPVVEGVANYFAAMIGNTDEILKKSKKYAKGLVTINSKRNKKYEYHMEDKSYAQLDFSFKFLYALKTEFGKEKSEELVYEAAKFMGQSQNLELKAGLLPALRESFQERSELYRFLTLTDQFGF